MARNRARYAQRTERQRLHDAHQRRMSGGFFRQHLGGASSAAGEYGSLAVINSAAQRFENNVILIERSFVCALSVRRRTAVLLKKQDISIFDVCSNCCVKCTCHVILPTNVFDVTYVSPAYCTVRTFRSP